MQTVAFVSKRIVTANRNKNMSTTYIATLILFFDGPFRLYVMG